MNQRDLARKIGCEQQTLSYWEQGTSTPTVSRAVKWCEVLGLDFWPSQPGGY